MESILIYKGYIIEVENQDASVYKDGGFVLEEKAIAPYQTAANTISKAVTRIDKLIEDK